MCWPQHLAPIHREKGKSQAQPGLTCQAQRSSLAQEAELRAPKPLAAQQSCHKHGAIAALQGGHTPGTSRIRPGHRSPPQRR